MDEFRRFSWNQLAREAPINQTTGKPYHGQTIARVARGEVANQQIRVWLEMKGISYAQTKKGTRNSRGKGVRRKGVQFYEGEVSELSKLTKAVRGKANSD